MFLTRAFDGNRCYHGNSSIYLSIGGILLPFHESRIVNRKNIYDGFHFLKLNSSHSHASWEGTLWHSLMWPFIEKDQFHLLQEYCILG
jgi:hypothetical protein